MHSPHPRQAGCSGSLPHGGRRAGPWPRPLESDSLLPLVSAAGQRSLRCLSDQEAETPPSGPWSDTAPQKQPGPAVGSPTSSQILA